jgi:hypothetical protein
MVRTWTFVDTCGNTSSVSQTITVSDDTPPVINCPGNTIIDCGDDTSPVATGTATGNDACGTAFISFEDTFVSDCSITRVWTATDACGNSSSCTQIITIQGVEISDLDFPMNFTGNNAFACAPPPDISPGVTGYPLIDGLPVSESVCNVTVNFNDETADLCSGSYKVFRTWTITDICANELLFDSMQVIEVLDLTPPIIDLPDYLEAPVGLECLADVNLPSANIQDDCSTVFSVRMEGPFGTMHSNGGLIFDLPIGTYQIIYIVTSDCDTEARDTLMVNVVDNGLPNAICYESLAVSLNTNGMAIVPASSFDGASNDPCGPIYFKAKRMDAPIGYDCFSNQNSNYMFDDEVKFCCEDIANLPIMVILRVYDVEPVPGIVGDDYLAGHFSECMTMIEVQDKRGPSIICPDGLTISCTYPYSMDNLSVFGEVVTDPGDREESCFDDVDNPNTIGVFCYGLDGLATDNCNVSIGDDASIDLDLCGAGIITRVFTATDDGGLTTSCTQIITIQDFTPFTEDDIEWPEDYEAFDNCSIEDLDPEDLEAPFNGPAITEGNCDLVAVSHIDKLFDFSQDNQACFKILRTWTVIDWCQFDNQGSGSWTWYQVLKVFNTVPPVITSGLSPQTYCTDDDACGPSNVVLSATAEDDCSGEEINWSVAIDEHNDLVIDHISGLIIGTSVGYPYVLPLGTHRILYTVEDFCGNKTTEEQFITIISCKLPTPICQDLIAALMPMDTNGDGDADWGMVDIPARLFDEGSNHACGYSVSMAYSPDPADTIRTFTCEDLGDNEVSIWVIDEFGSSDFCIATMTIQVNSPICPPPSPGSSAIVSGAIHSEEMNMIEDVEVHLRGTELTAMSNEDGAYSFPAMPLGGAYEVEPELDINDKDGVSTLDLLKIQKHLLGIQLLDSPYKMIAADANDSRSISAVDILELRKLILGYYESLPNNTSWRFVDSDYDFDDSSNPFVELIPGLYVIESLSTDMPNLDFVAIKIGDVNGSGTINGAGQGIEMRSGGVDPLFIEIPPLVVQKGETVRIPVYAHNIQSFVTAQFTLEANVGISLKGIVSGLLEPENWNDGYLKDGYVPVSWNTIEQITEPDQPLFTIIAEVQHSGDQQDYFSLSDAIAEREAFTITNELTDIVISKSEIQNTFELFQNRPNPFKDQTVISFNLDNEQLVRLNIYDLNGRILFVRDISGLRGVNEIVVKASQLGVSGVLMYEIRTENQSTTNRMIIVE